MAYGNGLYTDDDLMRLVDLSHAAYPGPWRETEEDIAGSETEGDGGDIICSAPDEGYQSREHWLANRAFIVASANFVRNLIRREQDARRAAIARAEGR